MLPGAGRRLLQRRELLPQGWHLQPPQAPLRRPQGRLPLGQLVTPGSSGYFLEKSLSRSSILVQKKSKEQYLNNVEREYTARGDKGRLINRICRWNPGIASRHWLWSWNDAEAFYSKFDASSKQSGSEGRDKIRSYWQSRYRGEARVNGTQSLPKEGSSYTSQTANGIDCGLRSAKLALHISNLSSSGINLHGRMIPRISFQK